MRSDLRKLRKRIREAEAEAGGHRDTSLRREYNHKLQAHRTLQGGGGLVTWNPLTIKVEKRPDGVYLLDTPKNIKIKKTIYYIPNSVTISFHEGTDINSCITFSNFNHPTLENIHELHSSKSMVTIQFHGDDGEPFPIMGSLFYIKEEIRNKTKYNDTFKKWETKMKRKDLLDVFNKYHDMCKDFDSPHETFREFLLHLDDQNDYWWFEGTVMNDVKWLKDNLPKSK